MTHPHQERRRPRPPAGRAGTRHTGHTGVRISASQRGARTTLMLTPWLYVRGFACACAVWLRTRLPILELLGYRISRV